MHTTDDYEHSPTNPFACECVGITVQVHSIVNQRLSWIHEYYSKTVEFAASAASSTTSQSIEHHLSSTTSSIPLDWSRFANFVILPKHFI